MEESLFNDIVDDLDSQRDVTRLSKKYGVPKPVLHIILTHKIVKRTRGGRFYKVKAGTPGFVKRWDKGESIVDIAEGLDFPPVLLTSFLLDEMGFDKKAAKKMKRSPDTILDERLRKEVTAALEKDWVYSPWAHKVQEDRAAQGEAILNKWLRDQGMAFKVEAELPLGKTPDFVLESEFTVDGTEIKWIDSKASFGSPAEHQKNMKRQLRHYLEDFGSGMVVYWFGFVDVVGSDGIVLKDFRYFEEYEDEVKRLFDTTGVEQ